MAIMRLTDLSNQNTATTKKEHAAEYPLHHLFEQAPSAIVIFKGPDAVFELANKRAVEIIGKSREELIGYKLEEALPELMSQGYIDLIKKVYSSGEKFIAEEAPVTFISNGKQTDTFVKYIFQPLKDENGNTTGVMVVGDEVAERVFARKKIETSEKNFREFVNKSPMSIMIVSGDEFTIELVNEKFLVFSGMKEKQLIGKKVSEVFPLMIKNGLDEEMKKAMITGQAYHRLEYEVDMRPYGLSEIQYFDFVYQPLKDEKGNFNRVMVMSHEVSELVRSRKKIEESEEQNRLFIAHAPAAMAMFDREMRYISASKRWIEEYDLSDNIIGKKHYDLFPNILQRWKEVHTRCMTGVVEKSEEDFYIKDDGTPVWLKWEVYPWYNIENEIGGIVIFTENITERKKDVQALKESEERLRMAFESAKIGAWEYDPFTQKLICSDESRHICGIPAGLDPDFNLMMKYIDPQDQERFIESIKKALSHKGDGTFEVMLRFTRYHDGELRWVKANGKVFFNKEHLAQKLIGTMMDVTEEKKQQLALKESEERYRTMFHFSPLPTWEEDFTEAKRRVEELKRKGVTDLDNYFKDNKDELLSIISTIKVKDVNKEAIQAYGGSREELLADLKNVFVEDTLPIMIEEFKMITTGGGRFEKEALVRNKKGDILNVICRIDFPENDDYSSVQVIWTDITERKKAELLLHKSEERFRSMANEAPMFVWETDEKLQTTFLNKEGYQYFGLDEKMNVSELSWKKFIHPDDLGNVLDIMHEASRTHCSYTLEMRLKNGSTGEYHWFLDKGSPRFQNDRFIGFIGTSLDINERKEIQKDLEILVSERTAELSKKNKELNEAQEIAELGSWEWNVLTNELTWSNTLYNIYGLENTINITYEKFLSLQHPDDRSFLEQNIKEAWQNKSFKEFNHRIITPSGQTKSLHASGEVITDENGNIIRMVGTGQDISTLLRIIKELEEIKEADKLKSDFIKIASHELNTPITSIKGYVQLLLNAIEKEKENENEKPLPPLLVRSSLISVDKQIKRLTRLISELLDISKIETGTLELKKEKFNFNELAIETIEDILYTNTKHRINLFHDFYAYVLGDKDRIGQVMINFLTNAIKYSPQSDKIDVAISRRSENEIAFSVKDYGIGIDKTEQEKIFERFYRAKGKAEQTYPGFGIGLFIAHEFIQKHGGQVWVDSEKGKGSTFTFTLPVLNDE